MAGIRSNKAVQYFVPVILMALTAISVIQRCRFSSSSDYIVNFFLCYVAFVACVSMLSMWLSFLLRGPEADIDYDKQVNKVAKCMRNVGVFGAAFLVFFLVISLFWTIFVFIFLYSPYDDWQLPLMAWQMLYYGFLIFDTIFLLFFGCTKNLMPEFKD